MIGFNIPGAWIDEVHALREIPKTSRPFDIRDVLVPSRSALLQDMLDEQTRLIAEWQASLPPGYELVLQETEPRFDQADENTYRLTYEVRPIVRPKES